MRKSKYLLLFPLFAVLALFCIGGNTKAYARTPYVTAGEVELVVQQATDLIVLRVDSNEARIGQLEETQSDLIDAQYEIQGTLSNLQSSVDTLSSTLDFAFAQIGELQLVVTRLDERVDWLTYEMGLRMVPPTLFPGALAWNVPSNINLVNGHELILNDFGLALPGNPANKVGAEYWFYVDLSQFEAGWNITLIPLAGQTSVIGYLKTDLAPGSSFQIQAYASYANRTWQKTITVHQPEL